MNEILIENNYLFVDNFITKEEAQDLYQRFKLDVKFYPDMFNFTDNQVPNTAAVYNYTPFIALLCEKVQDMNRWVGEKLLPTYTYARIYKYGDILFPHKDRPSCEISVTVNLGNDGTPWPIWFTTPANEKISLNLNQGQGVIYLGCISEHGREPFEGQEHGQVFLHYVRSEGRYTNYYFDRANTQK